VKFVLNCDVETMQPNHNFNALLDFLRDAQHRLGDLEKVKKELDAKSLDLNLNEKVFQCFKKEYYDLKRKQGLSKIALGAFIILLGFVITCFNFHSNQSFTFAMYGLTSIGICIVFFGLYKIIG
jgi:hypothetical protein